MLISSEMEIVGLI